MAFDALAAARSQMGLTLGFHMIFAALGIGMPLMLFLVEGLAQRRGNPHYRDLAEQWGRATALLFAVGAVSGTALSFELGLLWPGFMDFAGPLIGPPFSMETFAFFIEAVFIGLYLYGRDRLSPRAHWLATVPIAVGGAASAMFVLATNAWMQHPGGFTLVNGHLTNVDPLGAFRSPFWISETLHTLDASYLATGFGVAAVYAVGILRGRDDAYHRSGLNLGMIVATVSAILLPLTGDFSASTVAHDQPLKLAAMEALFHTTTGAPLTIGGIPDLAHRSVQFALRIPYLLSFLAFRDPHATVQGLTAFPQRLWPPVVLVHLSFDLMVGLGGLCMLLALWYVLRAWRSPQGAAGDPLLLAGLVVGAVCAFAAIELGWIVTEVGRQPWTVYGVLLTRDVVTPAGGILASLVGFTLLYLGLAVTLVVLLLHLARRRREQGGTARFFGRRADP